MRIVVIGTSGAGKTTLAQAIAKQFRVPHIELDAINWQAGWRDLIRHDPLEFFSRVADAIQADAWVLDGNYERVRSLVWQRATHVVWLDYARHVVMLRVVRRSLLRVLLKTELWAGNHERWRALLRPSHPIRWAWATWGQRRRDTTERLARPEYAGLVVLRLRHPSEARAAIRHLAHAASVATSGAGCLAPPCHPPHSDPTAAPFPTG